MSQPLPELSSAVHPASLLLVNLRLAIAPNITDEVVIFFFSANKNSAPRATKLWTQRNANSMKVNCRSGIAKSLTPQIFLRKIESYWLAFVPVLSWQQCYAQEQSALWDVSVVSGSSFPFLVLFSQTVSLFLIFAPECKWQNNTPPLSKEKASTHRRSIYIHF